MRYVMHYMPDDVLRAMLRHVASYHKGRLLIIQFTNADLVSKYANSIGETKWFRTQDDTTTLLQDAWQVVSYNHFDYVVYADFYRQRLGHPNPSSHDERICVYELMRRGR
jgi:hypothetical protein